ncbi:ATP-binding protein [Methylobacterium terricola]|uniref:ATP-binding protein n=1 Tax=Methylobacterium terricola TaxID=2583531 RepID=A0A5C4LHG0_9HYPH|nr:ATP-binding protein [Methylobacterium terricola]TNC12452.1 ATP-binding protein [Methylobacterium terricola]
MRLRKIILENFRGYRLRTEINIADFTSMVGRNDVGKSTILEALEIFFNCDVVKIDQQDAHVADRQSPTKISCVFDDFPSSIVIDAKSETSLAEEYLLNSDGFLEISKKWDCANARPKCTIFAQAIHPHAQDCADLLQLKQVDLKLRASKAGIDLKNVDQRSNVALRAAIRKAVGDLDLRHCEIPLAAEDAKKVWDQLAGWMPTFALFQSDRASKDDDPEIQDPMKLAVQAALQAVQPQLEHIKKQVEEHALEVARRTLTKLQEMDSTLARQLRPVFKAEPKWDGFKLSLTGDEDIPINKRGSGVRRLILLNFFRAEAERRRSDANSPGIIYAIEEPENSQHPKNQALLIKALMELSRHSDTQVLLTTHVPGIAGMLPAESIRFVHRGDDGYPSVAEGSAEVLERVADELGVVPDSRARVLVYVEGPHDVTFLFNMSRLLQQGDRGCIDIENDPRVAFVVTGGGNLQHWVNGQYLSRLKRVEVHIYDRDVENPAKYQASIDAVNNRNDGSIGLLTSKREMENYLHADAINASMGFAIEFTDVCDVPALVAKAQHEASNPSVLWAAITEKKQSQKISRAKKRLNEQAAAHMTLAHLDARDPAGEIKGWFSEISARAEASWNWTPAPAVSLD